MSSSSLAVWYLFTDEEHYAAAALSDLDIFHLDMLLPFSEFFLTGIKDINSKPIIMTAAAQRQKVSCTFYLVRWL